MASDGKWLPNFFLPHHEPIVNENGTELDDKCAHADVKEAVTDVEFGEGCQDAYNVMEHIFSQSLVTISTEISLSDGIVEEVTHGKDKDINDFLVNFHQTMVVVKYAFKCVGFSQLVKEQQVYNVSRYTQVMNIRSNVLYVIEFGVIL